MTATFDRAAWGYVPFMTFWRLFRETEVRELLAPDVGDRILDLGGGTGRYARALADHCREVVVVDESPKMLAKVPRHPAIRTLHADLLSTGLPHGGADAALLCDVLHHIAAPRALLAEARRLVRSGGRLVVYDFDRRHPLTRLLEGFETVFLPPVRFLNPEELSGLANETGWEPEVLRVKGPLVFAAWRAR